MGYFITVKSLLKKKHINKPNSKTRLYLPAVPESGCFLSILNLQVTATQYIPDCTVSYFSFLFSHLDSFTLFFNILVFISSAILCLLLYRVSVNSLSKGTDLYIQTSTEIMRTWL